MKISVPVSALAPQPTGHPASLPADPEIVVDTQTNASAANTASPGESGSRNAHQDSGQSAAPPSAIQIKISELLQQQAEDQKSAPTDLRFARR